MPTPGTQEGDLTAVAMMQVLAVTEALEAPAVTGNLAVIALVVAAAQVLVVILVMQAMAFQG